MKYWKLKKLESKYNNARREALTNAIAHMSIERCSCLGVVEALFVLPDADRQEIIGMARDKAHKFLLSMA